jgi:hypothetical protein
MPSYKTLLFSLLIIITFHQTITAVMRYSTPSLLVALSHHLNTASAQGHTTSKNISCPTNTTADLDWHAPAKSHINNLSSVINGTGTFGFIFNSSQGPLDVHNYCNMPHVNPKSYPRVKDPSFKLEYVEVIHRHHKRTPYADNTFPVETYPWYCDDEGLFYGGQPINPAGNKSADTYWSVYTSPSNPLSPKGFRGTCQFPQITRGGLDDSHQHGVDLNSVYSDLLSFLPADYDPKATTYRVTNNVITSQVASMLIAGMYPSRANQETPLLFQPDSIDSLEPGYSCPSSTSLFSSYAAGSSDPGWLEHINAAETLYNRLDTLSGVDPEDAVWHKSLDHYFDNLSSRLCHAKPLPCNANDSSDCVSLAEAETVFRLGEYEYSLTYRDRPESLRASTSGYGIWIAELAQHLRDATIGKNSSRPIYRHNVAHDGSLSRLLSILQIETMVWPGLGAEVVFELYNKAGCYFVRVLWGGQVLRSSHPAFGDMEMVPVETVLGYFDGLVGVGAAKIKGLCGL